MNVKIGIIPGITKDNKGRNIDFPDYRMKNDEILKAGQFIDISINENEVSPGELPNISESATNQIFEKIKKFDFPKGQCVTICNESRSVTPECLRESDFTEAVKTDLQDYLEPFFKKREFTEGAFL